MKRFICRIRRVACVGMSLLLLIFTLSSCYRSTHLVDDEETRAVQVAFTIAVSEPSESTSSLAKSATRASDDDTWKSDEDREKASGIENAINASNLYVVFYNNDGVPIGNVTNLRLTQSPSSSSDDLKYYEVLGNLDFQVSDLTSSNTLNGKIAVYANAPGSALSQNMSAVSDGYTYSYSANPSYIPMWGFKKINLDIKGGETANLGNIYLLRAMAKVTVRLTDDMIKRGYTFDGVKLNNYNTVGYCVPEYGNYAALDSTTMLTMAQSFHLNSTAPSTGSLDFTLADNKESTEAIYIPEYNNQTQTPTSITVRIKHVSGGVREATFDFGNYTSGNWTSAMNIVRNHHYVFSVYGDPIKVDLQVLPWTVFRHTPYTI